MENASKALIIAGAILLSILLISLGIMIFNQAQDSVQNSGMSKANVQTFNNTFLKYEGTKSGTDVKSLIQEVSANNTQDTSDNTGRHIDIEFTGKGKDGKTINTTKDTPSTSSIQSAGKYEVSIPDGDDGHDKAGYINKIKIIQQQ